jgi:chromosome partitioning protein
MLTISFVTQKGGVGKTTLAATLAVAAAHDGENVIALDLDPQGSLAAWGNRREGEGPTFERLAVEKLDPDRIPELEAILAALDRKGFTVAILDTLGADTASAHMAMKAADICLMPARPSRLDIEATGTTFRAITRMGRRVAFVLNQCPPMAKNSRSIEAAAGLRMLGVLADPLMSARADFQDSIAAGLGVTEYAPDSKAAAEAAAFWDWIKKELRGKEHVTQAAVGH